MSSRDSACHRWLSPRIRETYRPFALAKSHLTRNESAEIFFASGEAVVAEEVATGASPRVVPPSVAEATA